MQQTKNVNVIQTKQMKIKKSTGERIFDVINICLMFVVMLVTLYPVLYVVFASFSDSNLLIRARGLLLYPQGFSLEAYVQVFKNPMIIQGYLNTLIYVVLGVLISMVLTVLGAYALSRSRFMLSGAVMKMIVFTMYFGGGLIPFYILMRDIGVYDNLWAVVLPSAVSAMNLIIMRSAFEAVPISLEEAAIIDGGGHMTILMRIILPLSLPVLSVILLYYAVAMWNSWFMPSILIRRRELYPLQIVLREILIEKSADDMMLETGVADRASVFESIKYATIVVSTLPIMCVYPFLQKYFVKGAMIGAVKG